MEAAEQRYGGPDDRVYSYRGRPLAEMSRADLIACISDQERQLAATRDRELQANLDGISALRSGRSPMIVGTFLTGVHSLPVQEMRLDPMTRMISFVETFPGKTYATQLEADCDFDRKRAEAAARINDRMIELSGYGFSLEPNRPWWRFW